MKYNLREVGSISAISTHRLRGGLILKTPIAVVEAEFNEIYFKCFYIANIKDSRYY